MTVLELTEYRSDGNFYPIVVVVAGNFAVLEAELTPSGPVIIGQKSLGKGAFLVGVAGKHLVVRETVAEIAKMLKYKPAHPADFGPG